MQIQAILAPDFIEATPAQRARAHRALMEQMMLLARGHAPDSQAVRCAAALVGSAVVGDPAEFELAPTSEAEPRLARTPMDTDRRGAAAAWGEAQRETPAVPDWQRSEAYGRFLRTIMSGGPA